MTEKPLRKKKWKNQKIREANGETRIRRPSPTSNLQYKRGVRIYLQWSSEGNIDNSNISGKHHFLA